MSFPGSLRVQFARIGVLVRQADDVGDGTEKLPALFVIEVHGSASAAFVDYH